MYVFVVDANGCGAAADQNRGVCDAHGVLEDNARIAIIIRQ